MKASSALRGLIGGTAALFALGGVLACGSRPIPRYAVEGTTITIGVPGSFLPGFGHSRSDAMNRSAVITSFPTVPYVPGDPAEDEIRGELAVGLYGRSSSTFVSWLPVRYVTRVHVDEGSYGGTPDDGTAAWPGAAGYAFGQVLLLVDIPRGVVTANSGSNAFTMRVTRRARTPGNPSVWETLPTTSGGSTWDSWGGATQTSGIDIDIRSIGGLMRYNDDYLGWEGTPNYGGAEVADDLEDLVPRPKAMMVVEIPATADYPAAWEAEIEYPREKGDVIGVEASTNQKSTAVAMLTSPVPDPSGCPAGTGVARVSMADPRRRTDGVRLIVEPPDLTCSSSGRLAESDFVISSLDAYDVDGKPIDPGDVDYYFTGGIR